MKPASVGLLTGHTNLIFLSTVVREGQTEVKCFETLKKIVDEITQRFLSFLTQQKGIFAMEDSNRNVIGVSQIHVFRIIHTI